MLTQLPLPDEILRFLDNSCYEVVNLGSDYIELVDQSLARFSRRSLIVTGSLIELYTYQKQYCFNLSQKGNRSFDKHVNEDSKRRDDSIYRSKQAIRRIIDGNVWQYGCMPVFVTYTFGEHVTSVKEANAEWSKFVKRINRHFCKKFRYLNVIEFQKSGRVHFHTIYFDMQYIEGVKEKISRIWGNGFVNVKSVKSVKYIGGYVSKYLTKETMDDRLVGQKAYFCSRNIYKPVKFRIEELIDKVLSSGIIALVHEKDSKSEIHGLINYKKFVKNEVRN